MIYINYLKTLNTFSNEVCLVALNRYIFPYELSSMHFLLITRILEPLPTY